MKTKKKFDCVEMMHRGALKIYEKVRGMTLEEQAAYWRQQSKEFEEEIAAAKRKRKSSLKTGT